MTEQGIDYQLLVKALLAEKAAGTTPTAFYGHGPGGAFSSLGLSKPVFSSLILPYMGLGGMLPSVASIDTNPLWGIMTGVTAATGSNPTNVCDECKTAGNMKLCTHSLPFGRYCLDTKVYQVDRIGERRNRAEFTDLSLLNQAFGMNANGGMMPGPVGGGDPLNNEFNKAMFEFAVSWGLLYATQLWTGSPANNTAGGGYKEFIGLDLQINTGHVDAETGVACAGADSIIRSMANLEVSTNGGTYVRQITNVMRNLKFIGSRTGSNPVRWVIAMRWALFYELTEIWPCAYHSYRCSVTDTANIDVVPSLDSAAMSRMRDEMRGNESAMTGQYLLIDGQQVQVVIDDGITETINAGSSFTSSIYFIPITITGGVPVTHWEHFAFDGPNSAMEIRQMAPDGSYFVADGGRFLWHRKPPSNWCVEMAALTKPRIMLATPYLAARLTNVNYTPVAHERDWNTSASYYVDGGGYQRDFYGPSYYEPVPR
jgi:hypothetical protein